MTGFHLSAALVAAVVALGCQSTGPHPATTPPNGQTGAPGSLDRMLEACGETGCGDELTHHGFQPIEGATCPDKVCSAAGAGGLRHGKSYRYVGTAAMTLYRVYDNPQGKLGRYWSFDHPHGSQPDFRVRYEICPEWNRLTDSVACPLKQGAEVIIGPGQSVDCKEGVSYPVSSTLQVFVPAPAEAFDAAACHPSDWSP